MLIIDVLLQKAVKILFTGMLLSDVPILNIPIINPYANQDVCSKTATSMYMYYRLD